MKYKKFKESIELHQKGWDDISELLDLGFDLMEGKYKFGDIITKQFTQLMSSYYDKDGIDWINWFIHENNYGDKVWNDIPVYGKNQDGETIIIDRGDGYGAHDEDGNPICYSIRTLWRYLEINCKKRKNGNK
jgi:hypothetical protein